MLWYTHWSSIYYLRVYARTQLKLKSAEFRVAHGLALIFLCERYFGSDCERQCVNISKQDRKSAENNMISPKKKNTFNHFTERICTMHYRWARCTTTQMDPQKATDWCLYQMQYNAIFHIFLRYVLFIPHAFYLIFGWHIYSCIVDRFPYSSQLKAHTRNEPSISDVCSERTRTLNSVCSFSFFRFVFKSLEVVNAIELHS